MRAFKRCHRSWYLAYYLQYGVRPERRNPATVADLGTRVHLALEAYYGHDLDPLEVLRVVYEQATREYPNYAEELVKEHGYAKTMVSGYIAWTEEEGIDADTEVISTEELVTRDFTLRDGDTVTIMAKLDQKVRRRTDGAIRFRDFKTVSSFSKANLLAIDEQMRLYSLLEYLDAGETGDRADGGYYNMILRSKRTARATGPFFKQLEVSYNTHDHASMMARVRTVAAEIRDTTKQLDDGGDHRAVAYPNPGDYCGWGCPFTLICPMMDDGSRWEDALKANFVRQDPYGYYGSGLLDYVKSVLAPGMTEEKAVRD